MARVHDVQLREVPAGPEEYATKKEALEARPQEVVVDAYFGTQRSVEEAANRVNGNRRAEWPSRRYYAAWKFNPEATGAVGKSDKASSEPGRWELLIGIRDYMPEGWRKVVESATTRKRRSRRTTAEDSADVSAESADDQDYEDVA